jgi:exonuclease SbcC
VKLTVRSFGPYAGEQVFDFAALDGRSFFLIHGPTGAGKTSILDAICFALYGVASGNRDARQMRSDHAKPDHLTEVEFDFAIGRDRYRVHRRPEQERPKKRGAGTMVEKPIATLWRGGGGTLEARNQKSEGKAEEDTAVLEEGWARVNERVERLLGFQVDQFRQVVMLPQGMFQRLLLSNSKEREEILEALFAVEAYGRVEAALKEAAAQMKREREQATAMHAETLRTTGVAAKAELIARREEMEAQRVAAVAEADVARTAGKAAREALAIGKAAAEKLAERDRAAEELRKLEGRREEFVLKQARHDGACRAAGLVQFEEEVIRRNGECKRAAERLAVAQQALGVAAAAKAKADAGLEAEFAREPLREQAGQQVARLEQLREKVGDLAGAAAAVAAAQQQVVLAQQQKAEAEKSVGVAKASVEAAEKRRAALEAIHAQHEAIKLRHNRTGMEVKTRRKLEEQQRLREAVAGRVERVRQDVPRAAQTLAWARQTLGDLQARWNRGQAALLARSIEPGGACPVCGSMEHPRPARSDEELPSEEKLKGAAETVDRLAKEHAERLAELAKVEGELAGIDGQIANLREGMGLRIGFDVEALERELKELELRRGEAEAAGVELVKVGQAAGAAKAQEANAAARLAGADQAVGTAAAALSAAQAVLAERQAAVPEELRAAGALAREAEGAFRRRKALEDALTAARKAAEEAAVAAGRAQAELSSAVELAETTKALFENLRQQFSERAQTAGFADHAAFKAAKLSEEAARALDAEIREYHVALEAAKGRLERATAAAAADLVAPDLAQLLAADAAAQAALEAKINLIAQLDQRSASAEAALARLAELEKVLLELDARYQVTGAIADAANGQNSYRMTFQRYVLGVFLDEVLAAATQRLRTMSKGRFLLQRVTEAAGGVRAGGLDLQVHDTHTSTVRPVSTLSGGESFLASLSLALGLADVVQSYAGGIRLETIFVDEGFGTLDPESLDLAIRALRDLQKGGRLVGIISHVTELKEWIDARLEVVPGRAGSVARFVVG